MGGSAEAPNGGLVKKGVKERERKRSRTHIKGVKNGCAERFPPKGVNK
jgi:hypothetical protein